MRHHIYILLAAILFSALAASCKPEGPSIPIYLHLDKASVQHPTDGTTIIYGDAFLTSDIDAVQVECWWEGVDTTTNLGTFQLPCTIPVLTDQKKIKKIAVYPFVRQNAQAGTHIYYPYYMPYIDSNLVVAPDSVTNIGSQEADGRWNIDVNYRSTLSMKILKTEWFEPVQLNVAFDSIVERVIDADNARSGSGYGRVHISADEGSKTFFIKDVLKEKDPTAYLYVELDYWTDTRLEIGMQSEELNGGSTSLKGCVTLFPTTGWRKVYINLGRTWRQFHYNEEFRVAFTVLNIDRIDGDIRLDNVKVLSL